MTKPYQGRGHPKDCVVEKGPPTEPGRCVIAAKEVTRFPKGLCRREGKVKEYIDFGHYHCQMESKAHWLCALEQ